MTTTTKKTDAKADESQPVTPASLSGLSKPSEKGSFAVTLDEFCAQLSREDRRVSLIGGFHAAEKAARRNKDTVAAFRARYESFIKQPA